MTGWNAWSGRSGPRSKAYSELADDLGDRRHPVAVLGPEVDPVRAVVLRAVHEADAEALDDRHDVADGVELPQPRREQRQLGTGGQHLLQRGEQALLVHGVARVDEHARSPSTKTYELATVCPRSSDPEHREPPVELQRVGERVSRPGTSSVTVVLMRP